MYHLSSASVHLHLIFRRPRPHPAQGGAALTLHRRVQKAAVDSARPQRSGDPSPGAGIHVTRTPNPRASVSSGTLTSITNLATSLARNMDRLSLDEEHYNRQEEWRRQLPESLGEGLRQGLSRLGISLLGKGRGRWQRRSGVCSQPWRGQVPTPGRNQGWCGPSVFLQTKLRLRRGPQPGPHDPGVAAQGHPGAWAPPFRALVGVASPAPPLCSLVASLRRHSPGRVPLQGVNWRMSAHSCLLAQGSNRPAS